MTHEYRERQARLARELVRARLDALIVSGLPNIRYLTGFTGSCGLLLAPAEGEPVLFTDPRYQVQAPQEAACAVRVEKGPLARALMRAAQRRRLNALGFESGRISYSDYEAVRERLWQGARLEPVAGVVERLRLVKSPAEVEAIRGSMRIATQAYQQALALVRPGMLESELAAEIEYRMRRLGAERPAFETIVLSGERTALPHGRAGPHPISPDRLLLVDVGAVQAGYASDMTRVAVLGDPGPALRRLYQAVREAQEAALAAVRAGVCAHRVDAAARTILAARGLANAFLHSTGHGVGLEVHEGPRLGKGERTHLAAGMVVTVEPGAYLEGFGGVRIEDTVVVTSNGCEVLTPASKELAVL